MIRTSFLFITALFLSIIVNAQVATVGQDSWGNANGDGLVYASMAMKDSINAGTFTDTVYLSGTFTRPKIWQINAGGIPDNSKIVYKGEGIDKTIIQAFTDEELAEGTATWGDKNNLFIYLTGNIELHFVDLTIQNVHNAMGTDSVDHNLNAAISIGNDVDVCFKNVRFTNCVLADIGAAVKLSSGADRFIMEECIVDSCSAGSNAVVYLNNTTDADSLIVEIKNTVFKNNESLSGNGAAALYILASNSTSTVTLDLERCLFYKNLGYMHGQSVKIQNSVTANVYNCTFAYNEQSLQLGANVTADWFCHGASSKSNFYNTLFYGSSKAGVTAFSAIYPYGGATMNTNVSMENSIVGSQKGVNANALIALAVNSTISKDALISDLVLNDDLYDNALIPPLNSIAVDAGALISSVTDAYQGNAPDIGASESPYSSNVEEDDTIPTSEVEYLYELSEEITHVEVFLLMGQSNMKGRGIVPENQVVNSQIISMNMGNDKWYPAIHPLHTENTPDMLDGSSNAGVGPGLDFAQQIVSADTTTMVALIPCAMGGAWINLWMPGQDFYETAVARALKALGDFPSDIDVQLKAALWLQGESDATANRYPLYLSKLTTMVDSLRADLGLPNLPFLSATVGAFLEAKTSSFPYYNEINDILLSAGDSIDNYACIDARDLSGHIGDYVHYNTASQQEIGRRYAAQYKILIGEEATNMPSIWNIISLDLFPNPCSGTITIGGGNESGVLRFFDLKGECCFSIEVQGKQTLSLPLPKGLYIASLTTRNHYVQQRVLLN